MPLSQEEIDEMWEKHRAGRPVEELAERINETSLRKIGNLANPKQAYGDKKIKLQLVPQSVTIAIAKGLEEGAIKYGPWNWRDQPVQLMTYLGATYRHLAAWVEGEDVDPDSEFGKTHLEGAIASLAILIDALSANTYIDDRPSVSNQGVLTQLKTGARKDVS